MAAVPTLYVKQVAKTVVAMEKEMRGLFEVTTGMRATGHCCGTVADYRNAADILEFRTPGVQVTIDELNTGVDITYTLNPEYKRTVVPLYFDAVMKEVESISAQMIEKKHLDDTMDALVTQLNTMLPANIAADPELYSEYKQLKAHIMNYDGKTDLMKEVIELYTKSRPQSTHAASAPPDSGASSSSAGATASNPA